MYHKTSSHTTEFISHEEIVNTLSYAKANCNNRVLIQEILEKARSCNGLSHREAAVLLECTDKELTASIYELAKNIKQHFYGNRIVMFAPLYLSNYCINSCVY